MMAQLPGPNPSYVMNCSLLASQHHRKHHSLPTLLPLMARSMFSLGMLAALAAEIAASNLRFFATSYRHFNDILGSGPPC